MTTDNSGNNYIKLHCIKLILVSCFLAGCVTLEKGEEPTLQNICRRFDVRQQIITMFAENYTPINCRSSLEGVFHFSYQVNWMNECMRGRRKKERKKERNRQTDRQTDKQTKREVVHSPLNSFYLPFLNWQQFISTLFKTVILAVSLAYLLYI